MVDFMHKLNGNPELIGAHMFITSQLGVFFLALAPPVSDGGTLVSKSSMSYCMLSLLCPPEFDPSLAPRLITLGPDVLVSESMYNW